MSAMLVSTGCKDCTEATIPLRATIQAIIDPDNPISLGGNATMQVSMKDNRELGTVDVIAISVWGSGQMGMCHQVH